MSKMSLKNSLLEAFPLSPERPSQRGWAGQLWLSLLSPVIRDPEWVLGAARGPDADSGHHDFGVVGLVMGSTQVRLADPSGGPLAKGWSAVGHSVFAGRREEMGLLRGAGLGWGEQGIRDLVVIQCEALEIRHLIIFFFFLGGTVIIPFHR